MLLSAYAWYVLSGTDLRRVLVPGKKHLGQQLLCMGISGYHTGLYSFATGTFATECPVLLSRTMLPIISAMKCPVLTQRTTVAHDWYSRKSISVPKKKTVLQ